MPYVLATSLVRVRQLLEVPEEEDGLEEEDEAEASLRPRAAKSLVKSLWDVDFCRLSDILEATGEEER